MKILFGERRSAHIDIEQLSAYLDSQVAVAERARIEGHLRDCLVCRCELDNLRSTVALLRALPRAPLPRAFALSEVQVGLRTRDTRAAWYGGALRGLAAVTAVVAVAFVATMLLRQQTWTPGDINLGMAPSAPLVAIAPATIVQEQAQTREDGQAPPAATSEASTQGAGPTVALLAQAPEATEAPAQAEALPQSAPATTPAEPQAAMKAAPEAPQPAPAEMTPSADARTMAEAAPAAPATGLGVGGGPGGGAELSSSLSSALTVEPAPPFMPVADVLPPGAGLAYTDWQSLWTLDAESGARQLAQAPGANAPLVSPDRTWVVFRVEASDHVELWAARWGALGARMLLSDLTLPKDDLANDYSIRRLHSIRWIPGQHRLAVTTVATPVGPAALPKFELWSMDPGSGSLEYVLDVGQDTHVSYAPDGSRFVVLGYGAENGPEGTLTLYNADGTGRKALLSFPGGANRRGYESQLSWLPDSRGLWAAIPDPGADPDQPSGGATLYRVMLDGGAEAASHIYTVYFPVEAADVSWSPNGSWLAYTRALSASEPQAQGSAESQRELYVANANGSDAVLYAALGNGSFGFWSPDSEHFLYSDGEQAFAGAPGQPPLLLGNAVAVVAPRWIAPGQVVYLSGQGNGWMLVSRTLDGESASLELLPPDASYDVVNP